MIASYVCCSSSMRSVARREEVPEAVLEPVATVRRPERRDRLFERRPHAVATRRLDREDRRTGHEHRGERGVEVLELLRDVHVLNRLRCEAGRRHERSERSLVGQRKWTARPWWRRRQQRLERRQVIARTVPNTRNQMPGIRWVGMTTTIISTMIMINQKVRSRWTGAINQWRPPDQRGLRSPSEQHTRHRTPPVPPADAAPPRHGGHHRDSAEPNVSRVRRRHPPGAGQEACLQPLRVPVLRTWAEIACPNGPAGAYPPFSSGMPTGILCAPGTA